MPKKLRFAEDVAESRETIHKRRMSAENAMKLVKSRSKFGFFPALPTYYYWKDPKTGELVEILRARNATAYNLRAHPYIGPVLWSQIPNKKIEKKKSLVKRLLFGSR